MAKPIEESLEKTKSVVREFQGFLLRGNLVDLAVAVVIGAAFTSIVKSFTTVFIGPLIGLVFGGATPFTALTFKIHGQVFAYGMFLNDLLNFIVTCAVVFFLVVKPVGAMLRRLGYAPPADPHRLPCPYCATDIAVAAIKCPQCTSDLGRDWAPDAQD
jgi:large conductance mechanosensitive channel